MVKSLDAKKDAKKDVKKNRILVCVAWPYANGAIHIGHVAGSLLPGDIFARYHRMKGDDTIMISGSDEHGTPITVMAEKGGVAPSVIVDRYYAVNTDALERLGISFDNFFRTSHPRHKAVVQDMFLKLLQKGYIYKKATMAPYCPSCERFLPDRYIEGTCPYCGAAGARGDQCDVCGKTLDPEELIGPKCKLCGTAPEMRETEHFFFQLSAFSGQLLEYLRSKKSYWRDNVYKFTENYIKEGLRDRPITRDMVWGVEIPLEGYDDKRIYVWFEAVIGYLSSTKEWARIIGDETRWQDFWLDENTKSYYFIGKDNIPFHTLIWPAMLMGYGGLVLPYDVPANEFLTFGSEKFSKSKGIGMSVPDFLSRFDADALRYYLSVNMPENKDVAFSLDDFIAKNNDELVATLGNFIHRSLTFAQRYLGGVVPAITADSLDEADKCALAKIEETIASASMKLERCQFKDAIKEVMALAQHGNKYIDSKAPWKLIKEDKPHCERVIYVCLRLVKNLAILSAPFLPFAAQRCWAMIGCRGPIHEQRWQSQDIASGIKLPPPAPLFRKNQTEVEDVSDEKKEEKTNVRTEESSFGTLDIRVAQIIGVADHPNADKLYVLKIDMGNEQRQIVSGLKGHYASAELLNKKIAVIANLKHAKVRGVVSQGMLLAAEKDSVVAIVNPMESAVGAPVFLSSENRRSENLQSDKGKQKSIAAIRLDDFLALAQRMGTDKKGHVLFEGSTLRTDAEEIHVDRAKKIGAGAQIR